MAMKYWALATTVCILFASAFLLALADRHAFQWDMTHEGAFTLSKATLRALSEVADPIRISVFISTADPRRTDIDGLLRQVKKVCGRISFRLIDPQAAPQVVRELNITKARVMVFQSQKRVVKTRGCSELYLLSGLRRIMRTTKKKVYFLVGHNERDILSPQRDGARMFVEALVMAGLDIVPLKLQGAEEKIPQDCGAIVAIGPKDDLLASEVQKLERFFRRGGGLLLFAERIPGQNWQKIFSQWALGFHKAVAVDPVQSMNGLAVDPIVTDFRAHPAVRKLDAVVLHGARPLRRLAVKGVRHSPLLYTSRNSWGETSQDGKPVFSPQEDIKPPLMMACAAEKTVGWPTKEEELIARFLLIADEDVVVNAAFKDLSNADLGIGAVEWILGYGENIIMLPKSFLIRDVYLTPGQFRVIFAITIFGIPLLTAACGLLIKVARQ